MPVHQSDSESDEDYVPLQDNEDSDSDSEQSDKEDAVIDVQKVTTDPETTKRAREALWSSFQASVSNPGSSPSTSRTLQEPRRVKIERRYRFAGEEVVEVVEVLEDSPEAKKWPLWKEPLTEPSSAVPTEVSLQLSSAPVAASSNPSSPPTQTPNPEISPTSTFTSLPTKPPVRKPGPRKPKISLAPLPGPSKPKKLSTLDKSAMDWQTHVYEEQQRSGLKDELEANRKAGGYLDKVQFLKRVEERKDETLESLKSIKRRKL